MPDVGSVEYEFALALVSGQTAIFEARIAILEIRMFLVEAALEEMA